MRRRFRMKRYILDEHEQPIKEPDLIRWARWLEDNHAKHGTRTDAAPGVDVVTVFIGLGPVLWETMIIGGPYDGWSKRSASADEARETHAAAVAMAIAAFVREPIADDQGTKDPA